MPQDQDPRISASCDPVGPVDGARLDRLRLLDGSGGALEELVALYLADSPANMDALAAAAAAGDPAAVGHAAHAWRGSCVMTGAHRVAGLLVAIETLARAGVVPDRRALDELRRAYGDVELALRSRGT